MRRIAKYATMVLLGILLTTSCGIATSWQAATTGRPVQHDGYPDNVRCFTYHEAVSCIQLK